MAISLSSAAYAKYRGPLGNVRKGVLVHLCFFFNFNSKKFDVYLTTFESCIGPYMSSHASNCLNLVQQVSMGYGTTTAYALISLEPRGILFVTPGMEVA